MASTGRSLYRSLFRQCSYLPDPIARGYMQDYIRSSFRTHSKQRLHQLQLAHQHRRARKMLSLLTRACEGYTKALTRVLMLSYGRIGKRRHELIQPLLTPEMDMATALKNPDKLQQLKLDFSSDSFAAPAPLLALLTSQASQRHVKDAGIRPNFRLQLRIPEKNIWDRPMPLRRKANMRRKWYRRITNAALPFAPEDEVQILESLISGKVAWAPPRRRTPVGQPEAKPDTFLTPEFILRGARKGETFAKYVRGRPHHITPRLMRRIWGLIYSLIPRTVWLKDKQVTVIQWGLDKPPPIRATVKPDRMEALFAGVDAHGKLPRLGHKRVNSES